MSAIRPSRFSVVLHDGPLVTVGRFEIDGEDPEFASAGRIGDRVELVFPAHPVRIEQEGFRPFVADASRVVWYAPRQRYERSAIAPAGLASSAFPARDRCFWLAFDEELVERARATAKAAPAKGSRSRVAESTPSVALRAARLARALAGEKGLAPLAAEEAALALLADAIGAPAPAPRARPPGPNDRRLARTVEELLALLPGERWTLSRLGEATGRSPFHLARAFRRVTGRTIHRHLLTLRLREALQGLDGATGGGKRLALDLGFANPSHLSSAFRGEYGVPPSRAFD